MADEVNCCPPPEIPDEDTPETPEQKMASAKLIFDMFDAGK